MVKCVIYCRVSSLGQNVYNKSVSLRSQECICGKFSYENKLNPRRIYKEINSAYNKIPPVLSEVVNLKNTVIVIASVDRFSRSSKFGIEMSQKCIQNGNSLIFIREKLHIVKITDVQKLSEILKMTEGESKLISERVKTSKKYLKDAGLYSGGTIPYGYTLVKRKLVPHTYEQNVINFIKICKNPIIKSKDLNDAMKIIYSYEKYEYIDCYDTDGDVVSYITEPLSNAEISNLLNSYKIEKRKKLWNASKISRLYSGLYNQSTKLFKCSSMIQEINSILNEDSSMGEYDKMADFSNLMSDSNESTSDSNESMSDSNENVTKLVFNIDSPIVSKKDRTNTKRKKKSLRKLPYQTRQSYNKQFNVKEQNDNPPEYTLRNSIKNNKHIPKMSNIDKSQKEMEEFKLYTEFRKFKQMMDANKDK
jgi:DNA invertase Pin-like site-specific DNA recombinase